MFSDRADRLKYQKSRKTQELSFIEARNGNYQQIRAIGSVSLGKPLSPPVQALARHTASFYSLLSENGNPHSFTKLQLSN